MNTTEQKKTPVLKALENDKRLENVVVVFGFDYIDDENAALANMWITGEYKNVRFDHFISRRHVKVDTFNNLVELFKVETRPLDDDFDFIEGSSSRFTVREDNIDDFISHLEKMNAVDLVEYVENDDFR